MKADEFLDAAPSADEFLGGADDEKSAGANWSRAIGAGRGAALRRKRTGSVLDNPDVVAEASGSAPPLAVTQPVPVPTSQDEALALIFRDKAHLTPRQRVADRAFLDANNAAGRRRQVDQIREETDAAFGGAVGQALAAPGRRLLSGVASALQGVTAIPQLFGSDVGSDTTERLGVMAQAHMPVDPGIADEVLAGVGQVAPMAGGGALLRAGALRGLGERGATHLATGVTGAVGGAMSGAQVLGDLADRSDLTDQEKSNRALAAALFSALTGKAADRFLLPGADRAVGSVGQAAGRAFLAEGVQEGLDQVAQNFATDRSLGEGVGRATLVGALVGGGVRAVGETGSDAFQLARALDADTRRLDAPQVALPAPGGIDRSIMAPVPAIEPRPAAPAPAPLALSYDPNVRPEVMVATADGTVRPMNADEFLDAETTRQQATDLGLTPDVVRAQQNRSEPEPAAPAPPQDLLARLREAGWAPASEGNNPNPDPELEQQIAGDLEKLFQQDVKAEIRQRLGLDTPQPEPERRRTQSAFRAFLREIGIAPELAPDVTGERGFRANSMLPGTFRRGGLQLDELVNRARERGFITAAELESALDNGGTNRLVDMIRAEIRGERQLPADLAGDAAADASRQRMDAELEQQATAIGFDTRGLEPEQVASALRRIERRREAARARGQQLDAQREAAAEREAMQDAEGLEPQAFADLEAAWDNPSNTSTEAAMRALGFTDQEIRDALADESSAASQAGQADGQARPPAAAGTQAAPDPDARGDGGSPTGEAQPELTPSPAAPASPSGQLSRPDGRTNNTASDVRSALRSRFGALIDRLEASGRLKVWESVQDFNAGQRSEHIDGAAAGFYDGQTAHLFADGIDRGDEVAVLLHEVGEHASMRDMLGEQQYAALVQRAKDLVAAEDPTALAAEARIPDDTPAADRDSELLAYMVETVASQNARPLALGQQVRRLSAEIVAAVRAWFSQTKFARMLDRFGLGLALTPRDIAALAVRAVQWQARQETAGPGAAFAAQPTGSYSGNNDANTRSLFGDDTPDLFADGGGNPRGQRAEASGSVDVDAPGRLPRGTYRSATQLVTQRQQQLGHRGPVKNALQAAAALAHLDKSAVERLDALITDKDGNPLAVIGGFKGALAQASVYPTTLLFEAVRVPGAANIWFSHNHPSGDATLSSADKRLFQSLANIFEATGITPRAIIAVADGGTRAGYLNKGSFSDVANVRINVASDGTTVPVQEREVTARDKLGKQIGSPEELLSFAREISAQHGNEPGLILFDTQMRPVAFLPMEAQELMPLRQDGRVDALYRALSYANPRHVAIVDPYGGNYTEQQAQNIAKAIHATGGDVQVIDILLGSKSLAQAGVDIGRGSTFYSRPAGSAAARQAAAVFGAGGNRGGGQTGPSQAASTPWTVPDPGRLDAIIRHVQNNRIDIKRTVDAIRASGAQIADDANPYLADELYIGRVRSQLDTLADDRVTPLLRAIANSEFTPAQVNRYLWARHAEERNRQMARVNGVPFTPQLDLAGMSTADAQAELAAATAGANFQQLQRIAGMVDRITRETRAHIVAEGLEDAATIRAWEGAYKHYVPLQRDVEESGGRGQGYNVRGSESRRAIGSRAEAVNILANVIAQAESAIVRAEKARVGRAALALAEQNPNPDFWTVDTPPTERAIDPRTGIVTTRVVPNFMAQDNVFVVKENGQERYIVFNDRNPRAVEFARNLKNLDAAEMGPVISAIGKATRYLSQWVTSRNPLFWVTNFARDVQGVAFNLQGTALRGQAPQVLAKIPQALAGVANDQLGRQGGRWTQLAREFRDAGGQTGFMQTYENSLERMGEIESEISRMQQSAVDPRRLGRGLLEVIDGANDVIENGVRLAVFAQAREQGISRDQAASIAKNITVNFNRKGNGSSIVNALYMFANANVQGNVRMLQAVATSRRAQGFAAALTGAGALMTLLNWVIGGDDEESRRKRYELVPEWERERNWILFVPGSDKYVKVPLPIGPHVLFNAGRVIMESILEDAPNLLEKGASFAASMVGAFNPIGGGMPSADAKGAAQMATPSVVRPLVDLAVNQNFAGTPISKENNRPGYAAPAHTRTRESTPEHWKATARALNEWTGGDDIKPGAVNLTPEQVAYLVKSYLVPGVAQPVDKAAALATGRKEVRAVDVPGISKFAGQIDETNRARAAFDTARRDQQHLGEYKKYVAAGNREKALETLRQWGGGSEANGRKLLAQTTAFDRIMTTLRKQQKELGEVGDEETRNRRLAALDDRISRAQAVYLANTRDLRRAVAGE